MRIKRVFIILLLLPCFTATGQNAGYARRLIDTLSSPAFDGRGYVNEGCNRAARFLARQFDTLRLLPFNGDFLQKYSFPMNTFPGKVEATINTSLLAAGKDFQVWAATPAIKGEFKIMTLKPELLLKARSIKKLRKKAEGCFLLIDKKGIEDKKILAAIDSLKFNNFLGAKGLIMISDTKLTWSVMIGYQPRNYVVMDIRREALPEHPKTLKLEVENKFIPEYRVSNVLAYVRGTVEPDSFLVFTAHFDHLGRMGKDVMFPGANDNASGTSMVMDLARHYSREGNKPYYSMAFFLFSGEEAGLQGAEYCASHPPLDLRKVKFLINLDMVGTGSEGITVVNATKYKGAFRRFEKINADNEYLMTVKERGESCNSDHCPFYKLGVPSVFIYSMGKEFGEYHNPDDQGIKLPLTEYADIFRLVRDFMDSAKNLQP